MRTVTVAHKANSNSYSRTYMVDCNRHLAIAKLPKSVKMRKIQVLMSYFDMLTDSSNSLFLRTQTVSSA